METQPEAWVVRVGSAGYLGRRSLGEALRLVERTWAYEFEAREQAQRLADNWAAAHEGHVTLVDPVLRAGGVVEVTSASGGRFRGRVTRTWPRTGGGTYAELDAASSEIRVLGYSGRFVPYGRRVTGIVTNKVLDTHQRS